ncbi:MAG: phenylacetate--CoA ligase family protein [Beutenbergiaceae bacterium]
MPGTRSDARRLASTEQLPPGELERRGRERTMALARFAFDRTPFYREHFGQAGLRREDLVPQNLAALPLLTKAALRDGGADLRAQGVASRRFLPSVTGGSTGSPLEVYNDRQAPHAAMWWRCYRWWDIDPGDDVALIYRRKNHGRAAVIEQLTWWPTRRLLLDARALDDAAIEGFLTQWRRVKPRLIIGYVEAVMALARRIREHGESLPRPAAISVTSSVLHPGQRDFLEEVFAAPVYDSYRSAEVPWIAAECQQRRGLHIQADIRHVEIVDPSGTPVDVGEDGAVVITDLTNSAFPLIRYAIGDRSRQLAGTCECGRTLPRLSGIQGRLTDVLATPSGRQISGGLSGLFNRWPRSVRQFQIYQHADFRVELRYVRADGPDTAHAVDQACAELAGLLHHEAAVSAVEVPEIEQQGGKARLVRSDAPPPTRT